MRLRLWRGRLITMLLWHERSALSSQTHAAWLANAHQTTLSWTIGEIITPVGRWLQNAGKNL
jgi:hypothetical protein